jgi:hypothetical protein
MNWRDVVTMIILVVVFVWYLVWAASNPERLRQYEVTLGDGTTATCVVVEGYRSAGVTCIPHVVVAEDDAVGDEVKP